MLQKLDQKSLLLSAFMGLSDHDPGGTPGRGGGEGRGGDTVLKKFPPG